MARILLIDDSPLQVLCMSRILQGLAHQVVCRADPRDVLRRPPQEEFDLVLIELLMRAGNGFEVGLQLREAGHARVLLLAGVYRETDEIWAQALGLLGVITRPLPTQRLQERLAGFLLR